MAVKVSFGNINLMSDGEGNCTFTPGFIGRDRAIIKLAQAEGLLYQELGSSGAEHYLELRFRGVSADTIRNRVEQACRLTESTLEVRGFSNVSNCIVNGKPQMMEAPKFSRNLINTPGMSYFVRIVFTQLY